jgi:hypothetical protein
MQRPVTTNETPAGGTPDASNLHFRDQTEPAGTERDDATLEFKGRMHLSGEDEFSGDPYNRTGRFKRAIR